MFGTVWFYTNIRQFLEISMLFDPSFDLFYILYSVVTSKFWPLAKTLTGPISPPLIVIQYFKWIHKFWPGSFALMVPSSFAGALGNGNYANVCVSIYLPTCLYLLNELSPKSQLLRYYLFCAKLFNLLTSLWHFNVCVVHLHSKHWHR